MLLLSSLQLSYSAKNGNGTFHVETYWHLSTTRYSKSPIPDFLRSVPPWFSVALVDFPPQFCEQLGIKICGMSFLAVKVISISII